MPLRIGQELRNTSLTSLERAVIDYLRLSRKSVVPSRYLSYTLSSGSAISASSASTGTTRGMGAAVSMEARNMSLVSMGMVKKNALQTYSIPSACKFTLLRK